MLNVYEAERKGFKHRAPDTKPSTVDAPNAKRARVAPGYGNGRCEFTLNNLAVMTGLLPELNHIIAGYDSEWDHTANVYRVDDCMFKKKLRDPQKRGPVALAYAFESKIGTGWPQLDRGDYIIEVDASSGVCYESLALMLCVSVVGPLTRSVFVERLSNCTSNNGEWGIHTRPLDDARDYFFHSVVYMGFEDKVDAHHCIMASGNESVRCEPWISPWTQPEIMVPSGPQYFDKCVPFPRLKFAETIPHFDTNSAFLTWFEQSSSLGDALLFSLFPTGVSCEETPPLGLHQYVVAILVPVSDQVSSVTTMAGEWMPASDLLRTRHVAAHAEWSAKLKSAESQTENWMFVTVEVAQSDAHRVARAWINLSDWRARRDYGAKRGIYHW